jgi:hypothetical protein
MNGFFFPELKLKFVPTTETKTTLWPKKIYVKSSFFARMRDDISSNTYVTLLLLYNISK